MSEKKLAIKEALSLISKYWGKARSSSDEGDPYHLLPFHCLDVTAVAAYWWDHSFVMRNRFVQGNDLPEEQVRAWVLFFIALHDLGKFDIRFQCKADSVWILLNPDDKPVQRPSYTACKGFDHGRAGLYWFVEDSQPTSSMAMGSLDFLLSAPLEHPYQEWFSWLEAVTGHHGYIVRRENVNNLMLAEYPQLAERDKLARQAWLKVLEALFLEPVGLSLEYIPPAPSSLLAAFCSISDWLGSWISEDTFLYRASPCDSLGALRDYFQEKYKRDAALVIARSGLIKESRPYGGVASLLKQGYEPRQLQVLVDHLPIASGLTQVEGPTGSGKTELALAYAWRLLEAGLADSIVFALPTQATANAMLSRLGSLADKLFDQPNIILAHGNSRFNEEFKAIKQRGGNVQQQEEAWAQCCEWLTQSRKRVFLGQIGVCTIDQVLVSVLPVRHRFIRGFVGRSILIVDEVHAYSTYMYGLLEEVLKQQARAGGSAILLSATLPKHQKRQLMATYGEVELEIPEAYPLVSWKGSDKARFWDLEKTPEHQPNPISLTLEPYYSEQLIPTHELLERMVDAVEQEGAQVCLICNLVDVAQQVYEQLKALTHHEVILFHSRFTLIDRQAIEEKVLSYFGPDGNRSVGRILVSTQVVEQSLDLDFDWQITQLCPVDLLFQRFGRVHRHKRDNRPKSFPEPKATVLLPKEESYGGSGVIYSNTVVMWRTQQHIEALGQSSLQFPPAYRDWIEPIYQKELKGDEPEWVRLGYEEFKKKEFINRGLARQMLEWAKEAVPHKDDEANIRAVTRDGDMSLPVIPYIETAQGKQLLDGKVLERIPEFEKQEAQILNRVNVPSTWKDLFLQKADEEGLIWLPGQRLGDVFEFKGKKGVKFVYSQEKGLEKQQ
ncbi:MULTISPECIES: CRISPR-associated helicase/endonuclease Cas3 [Marinomonas]|uniref:CRISPR-associated helicase/endonuclease Cas3 n=1 Tax=Marinomonas rhodophyticola TaxID=2992803 RepID=A0ABT3KFQ0_9GAMM|nr:CRISPR-associated helicase/endonuclease Cas3 [Marinomonas sp. KJ51-3]MCW4629269.1 CRISPR-associated helicase/endonuclease Cas3 [Marinomonas sp. KJ51-3]